VTIGNMLVDELAFGRYLIAIVVRLIMVITGRID
jgi:hypothetical protein